MFVENVKFWVEEAPKVAVPVGTVAGSQFEFKFQLLVPGFQVASWPRATDMPIKAAKVARVIRDERKPRCVVTAVSFVLTT